MLEHLSREQISGLLDDPDRWPEEAEHLASCEECSHEFEHMSRMRMALSALPALDAPADEWERVQRELGLHPETGGSLSLVLKKAASWPLQAAAVVALFAAGIFIGQRIATDVDAPTPASVDAAAPTPRATAGADETVNGPEEAYLRTVADLQALKDGAFGSGERLDDPEAIAERITRLDAMIEASREALDEAPADPVLNNFLFQMVDERDVLAGELNQTLRMTAAEY